MVHQRVSVCLLILALVRFSVGDAYGDVFHEELFIKPLASGHINTYFQFTTKWQRETGESLKHTNMVPRSIAELFDEFNIRELHVSLTSGLWRHELWGYPVVDAAPGAELLVWFDPAVNESTIDRQWMGLCGSLSGLLCASLSFIDKINTQSPRFTFRPTFAVDAGLNETHVRYATLPREIVCTENLTPWKKLLPCNSAEGFASLLKSDHIYSTSFHSEGIHVRLQCEKGDPSCRGRSELEIRQTVNLVYDPVLIGSRDWSVRRLFGQGLNGVCPLASSSRIYVDVTSDAFVLTPEPGRIVRSVRGGSTTLLAEYDIRKLAPHRMFNLAIVHKEKTQAVGLITAPPLHVKRFVLGVGQENGVLVTKVTNTHWTPLNVILNENIPWFLPVYLHTLAITTVGENRKIGYHLAKYVPGRQRERPSQLELAFTVPARTSVQVTIDFEYIFLRWQEFPPDANHGHYVGSAIVSAWLPIARNFTSTPIDGSLFASSFNASRTGYLIQLRTEVLLLSLPTPDFSMPYNVICLACTVVALAFGPIHNMCTKKIVLLPQEVPPGLLAKLKQKLMGKKTKTMPSAPKDNATDGDKE